MRQLFIKSVVIALVMGIIGNVVSDILFAVRTEPYTFSKEEMAANQKLTLEEFSKKYDNPKVISGLEYVLNYPMDWWFLKQKLKHIFLNFCLIFISCLLLNNLLNRSRAI